MLILREPHTISITVSIDVRVFNDIGIIAAVNIILFFAVFHITVEQSRAKRYDVHSKAAIIPTLLKILISILTVILIV